MSNIPPPDTAGDRYASIYDGYAQSPTLRRIWATTYREDYPADAEPYGFVTLTDLRRMAEALAIGPHDTFADVGCGRGGPGLWIARQTGASLIGIDASPAAIRHATARASAWGLQDRGRFQLGEFARTRLAGGMLAGVMSTDAFLFAPDLQAACHEMARIIRAGGCFVFTSFELFKASTHFQLAPIHDYRPMLEVAGFTVEHYEETPDWERRMRMVFAGIVAEAANLRREVGDVGAASFQRSCMRSLRIIHSAQKPATMSPFHHPLRGHYHDTNPLFLPTRTCCSGVRLPGGSRTGWLRIRVRDRCQAVFVLSRSQSSARAGCLPDPILSAWPASAPTFAMPCYDHLRLSRFMPLSPLVPWGTEVYSTFTVVLDSLDSAGTSR